MDSTLAQPPPGVQSDLSNAGWAPAMQGFCIVLLVLNTLFVALRLYTRAYVLRTFGIDDYFCIIAYGMVTTTIAWNLVAIHYGFGRHIWDIPKANALGLYKSFSMVGLLVGLVYFSIKMTLLLSYSRIFNPTRSMRWLIWGGMAVCIAFYTGDFFYDLFKCRPIAKSWNPFLKGTCAKEAIPGSPTGIFNVITDTYLCLLPMPMVWKLNMSWKRKVKVLSVFSLGILTVAMSVVRLAETILETGERDFSYHYGPAAIFANLEYSVGLMVACMLVLPAFWDRVLRKPLKHYWTRASSAYQSATSLREDRFDSRKGSVMQTTEIYKTTTFSLEHEVV